LSQDTHPRQSLLTRYCTREARNR